MKVLVTWAIMSLAVLQSGTALAKNKPAADNQLLCLAKNIYYEAGLETREGMIAVAQVTLNRAEDGKFPKTVCGVVNQKTQVPVVRENKPAVKTVCQFSWTCMKVSTIKNKYLWDESKYIAVKALTEPIAHVRIAPANAMYYHASYIHPNWDKKGVVIQIGNHIFYTRT